MAISFHRRYRTNNLRLNNNDHQRGRMAAWAHYRQHGTVGAFLVPVSAYDEGWNSIAHAVVERDIRAYSPPILQNFVQSVTYHHDGKITLHCGLAGMGTITR